jgi:glycosyltransferase involved in cell wall biosynthesis
LTLKPASSPARVLQVVLSLNPGGTERLVVELARRLHSEIPTAVCCLDDAGAWGNGLREEGIEVTALERPAGFHPALGRQVADAARRHRASVLHCHHYSPFVYGCLAKLWGSRSRILFTEHGRLTDSSPSKKRGTVNRILAKCPDGVFAVSNDLKQYLVEEGFSESSIRTIYNGIDIGPPASETDRAEVRQRLGADEGTIVVGTIARLDPVKDLKVLIAAVAALLAKTCAMLVVVGDGPERPHLEVAAAASAAARQIRFVGHQDDARRWLAGCDIYANSSVTEGVSLTILEAMAAGLPVVATRVGGTPEVVDASCGRLVPARDAAALASALTELAETPGLRRSLGGAARSRAIERFSIERMVDEYKDLYVGA